MPSSRIDFDALNDISKRLGEAALDPSIWPSLMQDICHAAQTTGAGLLQSDIRTADIPTTESAREIFASYFQNNFHINDVRAVRGAPKLLQGAKVISDQDLFSSEAELLRDPLYAHLGSFGFRWWSAIGFRAGDASWALTLQRTTQEGMFETDELKALAHLSDRLTETATLSKAVGRQIITGMTNAFDLLRQPALSVDRTGAVIEINRGAEDLFDDDFCVKGKSVVVKDGRARSALADLVGQLQTTQDSAALLSDPIIVRRSAKHPILIRVIPVDGAAKSPFLGARAILILTEIGRRAPSPDQKMLQRLFDLTPAESRLASMIASGNSLDDIAKQLGNGRETLRNQLKTVFAKTGAHRQPELVALLATLRL